MASCLYQETRLNLNPALPPVELLVPSNNNSASAFASRESPKRRRVERPSQAHDEEAFSGSLATESSIHFRPHTHDTKKTSAPRAVFWRLLEHRSLLELQAVELSQDRAEKNEPVLTLRLGFPDDIKPTGVAFAEEDTQGDAAALVVFVLTVIGELYTLTLKKEAFVPPGALKERSDWCKSCTPSALGYRTPVRVVARSAREVWVALGDGGMVRLERGQADDGVYILNILQGRSTYTYLQARDGGRAPSRRMAGRPQCVDFSRGKATIPYVMMTWTLSQVQLRPLRFLLTGIMSGLSA